MHLPATLMLTGFLHPLVGVGTKAIGSKVDGLGRDQCQAFPAARCRVEDQ